MVLLACYECGNDVSSAAASCPKCGAPFEPQDDAHAAPAKREPPACPPLPVAATPAPATEVRQSRGIRVSAVLAVLLLAFGCYELATTTDKTAGWVAVAVAFLMAASLSPKKPASASPSLLDRLAGLRPKVVCKHCGTAGQVFVNRVERKRGISGGKAAGALFTGGLSLLATGLSRKEAVSSMRCKNCGMKWDE